MVLLLLRAMQFVLTLDVDPSDRTIDGDDGTNIEFIVLSSLKQNVNGGRTSSVECDVKVSRDKLFDHAMIWAFLFGLMDTASSTSVTVRFLASERCGDTKVASVVDETFFIDAD